MYLQALAPVWRDLYRQLVTQTQVLVIDDEPEIAALLENILSSEGYTVSYALSAEDAMQMLGEGARYDLAIVDHHLPGKSGIEFIRTIREAGVQLPCMLATGSPTTQIIAGALSAGAADYLAKPFGDIQHMLSRIRTVVDRTATKLLFDVIVRDLTDMVEAGGIDDEQVKALSRELFAFKTALSARPQAIIFDDDELEAETLAMALKQMRVLTIVARSPDELFGAIRRTNGPLAVVLALEVPNATLTIKRVRREDPQVEVLATAQVGNLEAALSAVTAGAADFVLRGQEGMNALANRVRRLVRRGRRHRLYLHLVGTLYSHAKRANPDLADDLVLARAEEDAAYIRNVRKVATTNSPVPDTYSLDNDFADGERSTMVVAPHLLKRP